MGTGLLELTPHGVVICRAGSLTEFSQSDAAGLVALAGRKLKIEAEAVGIYGSIGNMSTSGGITDRDAYADPVSIMQYGFAIESSYKFLHDALVVGFDAGMASGDDAPGFGLRPAQWWSRRRCICCCNHLVL